jgi:tRNA(Ile2) C34 agmatinyltransferase TiaS
MWTRICGLIFALAAALIFRRFPSPDSIVLAMAGLMVLAVMSEEIWEKFTRPRRTSGPHCPQCDYDVRATPVRCPECGTILNQPAGYESMFSKGAEYHSVLRSR